MGLERVRHLVHKGAASYWQPSKRMRAAGFLPITLTGTPSQRVAEAERLNGLWDKWRGGNDKVIDLATSKPVIPDSVAALVRLYRGIGKEHVDASEEFAILGAATKRTYNPWLDSIEDSFHDTVVKALSPKVVKTYYRSTCKNRGLYAGYHMMGALRTLLSFGVSEDWLPSNPALLVPVKTPPKRTVKWEPAQTKAMIEKADASGRRSIALAIMISEWLGQRPGDIWRMKWSAYDGQAIQFQQEKTQHDLPRIPVSPELKARLDAELVKRSAAVKTSIFIIVNEETSKPYNDSAFQHRFADIRLAAGLPFNLRFADFRRTAITDIVESGATDDEARAVSGHKDRNVLARYAPPSDAMAANAMTKRTDRRARLKKEAESA